MFQVIRTRNKEIMDVQICILSTTLQIWCYYGHVIESRTMRHLNFDCQLNLSKSHKGLVIISCVVSAQCRKVWLGNPISHGGGGVKKRDWGETSFMILFLERRKDGGVDIS